MTIETDFGSFPDALAKYVRPTKLADADTAIIRKAANTVAKECKTHFQVLRELHDFVATLPIGFDDERLPASKILRKGRGQCNTKTTLFVALCRVLRLPCRVHAWRIHKSVHKENFPWLVYVFTPKTTLFTYPEVYYKGKWQFLSSAISKRKNPNWDRCPFDDAKNRNHPLKKEWIAENLGPFWHPDSVVEKFGTNADGWRRLFFPLAKKLLN